MNLLLRVLLGLSGSIYLLGAFWFPGGKDSYLGFLGGTAMFIWSALWTSGEKKQLICFASLITAAVAAGWLGVNQLLMDNDASVLSISFAFFIFFSAFVWVRQQSFS